MSFFPLSPAELTLRGDTDTLWDVIDLSDQRIGRLWYDETTGEYTAETLGREMLASTRSRIIALGYLCQRVNSENA